VRLASALAADPTEAWIKFQDRYVEHRERRRPILPYEVEPGWERHLHDTIRAPWPCPVAESFPLLWDEVVTSLCAKGVRLGPQGFGNWNDGDAGLVRAIRCLVHHFKPGNVVETGVGHGVTSRFILEALERTGAGHLWSIDVPPMDPVLRSQVGMVVGGRYPDRWSYIQGSSRRRLPALLSKLASIDLFIHDSLHSARNVRFELDHSWKVLRPGGVVVVDDIDANDGFHSFVDAHPGCPSCVCEAEPLHPDTRRFNNKGLFGIVVKAPLLQ